MSILCGVSIIVARIINSNLADKIGILQGTFINYVVGLIFSVIFLLLSREFTSFSHIKFYSIPLWVYSGGLVGVIVVVLSSYIVPKIPVFCSTLIIFVGQLFAGILIDYINSNKLSIGKLIGGIMVLIGLTYNLLVDKKEKVLESQVN
jgi:transporter family-2 protein